MKLSVRHLLFSQPPLLFLLPPAFLFLPDSASVLPPPLQLLQLLLGFGLSVSQLLQLLALLLLEASPDLLQTLLRLQDGLGLPGLTGSVLHTREVLSMNSFTSRQHVTAAYWQRTKRLEHL